MGAFISRLAIVTKMLAGVILGLMTIMVGIVIAGRYLNFSVAWADELARIFFVWSALLGAASATHNKLHFTVSFVTSFLSKATRLTLATFSSLLMVAILIFILIAAIGALSIAKIQILPALQISKVYFHLPVTISCILMTLFVINHLFQEYSGKRGK